MRSAELGDLLSSFLEMGRTGSQGRRFPWAAALALLAAACATAKSQGPSFERWDRWLPTTVLRLCNDYYANFVVVLDGRRRVHLASKKCVPLRVHVGRHFLIPRGLQFGGARFHQSGWVVTVPLGLAEVRFGNRKNLVDLLVVRGEGAEAWAFQQRAPEFDTTLRRPLAPGQLRDPDPLFRSSGEQVRLAPPPRSQRIIGRPFPGPPARVVSPPWIPAGKRPSNATVVADATRPGLEVQRFAVVVGGGGMAGRRWQRVCALPCRFQVEPGRYRFRFAGGGRDPKVLEANLVAGVTNLLVKPGPLALKHAGGISVGFGVILAALGVGLVAKGFTHGWGLLGGGLGGVTLGTAFVLWSHTTVDIRSSPLRPRRDRPGVVPARVVSLGYGWRW